MGSCIHVGRTRTLVVVGLDGAGKSTVVSCMEGPPAGNVAAVGPTAGLQLHKFTSMGIRWHCWDMGGQGRYRQLWPAYFHHSHAIVFVVDVTDVERCGVIREEVRRIVDRPDVQRSAHPILFCLNKSDKQLVPGKRITETHLRKLVGYESLRNAHKVKIVETSGVTGSGVDGGLLWLSQQV